MFQCFNSTQSSTQHAYTTSGMVNKIWWKFLLVSYDERKVNLRTTNWEIIYKRKSILINFKTIYVIYFWNETQTHTNWIIQRGKRLRSATADELLSLFYVS